MQFSNKTHSFQKLHSQFQGFQHHQSFADQCQQVEKCDQAAAAGHTSVVVRLEGVVIGPGVIAQLRGCAAAAYVHLGCAVRHARPNALDGVPVGIRGRPV